MEITNSASTLKAHWSGLLQAATLDALGRPAIRTPAALARSFAERVENTRLLTDGPAGLGQRVRGGGRVGTTALRWSDRTVHLTAIAQEA